MLLHRGTLRFPLTRAAGRLSPALAATALALVAGGRVEAQAHPGSLATRSACLRGLAEWTLGGETGPGPFQLQPAVGRLLDAGAPARGGGAGTRPAGEGSGAPTQGARVERTDLAAGIRLRRGALRAGESVPADDGFAYPGPVEEPRRSGGAASLVVREAVDPVALVVDAAVARTVDVPLAQLGIRTGEIVLSAGRQGPWPGNGCSSGLVLAGRGRAAGFGIDTGWLRLPLLGPFALSGFVGTLPEGSTDRSWPFFLAQRAVWPLTDDVRVGLTRAAIFGGRGGAVSVTPLTVGLMLLGITDVEGKDSDFENQVASVDVSWRVPAGASAVRLHLEYAADDFGRAFLRVPALSLGADLATPNGPDGVRVLEAELTWIAPSTDAYPEWYRHGALAWGWTDRGTLLGHDLAGEGWALRLGGFSASADDEYSATLLLTRRGDENLLAPRAGGWGVEVRTGGRVGLPLPAGVPVLAGWHLEAGRLGGHGLLAGGVSVAYRF